MTTPVYYPSLAVNLRVRFDEALHIVDRMPPSPISVEDLVNNKTVLQGRMSSLRPLVVDGAADNMTFIANRVPITARIGLNGYRQAHKWNLEFDYRDFPVDPRVIRAVGIEIYLGVVQADEFQRGIRETPDVKGAARESQIKTRTAAGFPQNLVLIGVADTISSSFTNGHAKIAMEGRDQRGIFLDQPYVGPNMFSKLDYSQPIHKLVQQILSFHPAGTDITVAVNADDFDNGVPIIGAVGKLTRPNMGASGTKAGVPTAGAANKLTFWDIITNYCYLVGTIPYFDYGGNAEFAEYGPSGRSVMSVPNRTRLVIRPVRSLYDNQRAGVDPRFKTPFSGGSQREIRTEDGSEALSIRRLVYGRDIAEFSFERKMQGAKPSTVEVVSVNTSSTKRGKEKLLSARWPDDKLQGMNSNVEKAKVTSVSPSGNMTSSDITYHTVYGISDVAVIRQIAKAIYEEIGRGEMGGKVSTKDLASFGAGNDDADILRLRPGDPVQLLVDAPSVASRPPIANELTDHYRRSFDEEVRAITDKLGDPNVARVLVACARNAIVELQNYFRVGNVNFSWDIKSGIGVDFDFQNYVEARYKIDKDKANQKNPSEVVTPRRIVGTITPV